MKIVAIEEHVLPDAVKQAWNTIPGADDGTLALNTGYWASASPTWPSNGWP